MRTDRFHASLCFDVLWHAFSGGGASCSYDRMMHRLGARNLYSATFMSPLWRTLATDPIPAHGTARLLVKGGMIVLMDRRGRVEQTAGWTSEDGFYVGPLSPATQTARK